MTQPDDAAVHERGFAAIDEADIERRRPIRAGLNGISYGSAVVPALTPDEESYEIGYIHPPGIDTGWMTQAACVGLDTNIWFPNRGRGQARAAIEICDTCPVSQECGEYGLIDNVITEAGVFGGMTASQRRLQAKPPLPEVFR